VNEGFSYTELSDYDKGVTVEELFFLMRETQKMVLLKEKKSIYAMTVSLSALFNQNAIMSHFKELDSKYEEIDGLSLEEMDEMKQQTYKARKSVQELSKLGSLMGMK
jgi:hypothetical protein